MGELGLPGTGMLWGEEGFLGAPQMSPHLAKAGLE